MMLLRFSRSLVRISTLRSLAMSSSVLPPAQAVDQVLGMFRRLGSPRRAPILGGLVLDLIERLELLEFHPQHFIPDDPVVLGVDRIVLDAGVGGDLADRNGLLGQGN